MPDEKTDTPEPLTFREFVDKTKLHTENDYAKITDDDDPLPSAVIESHKDGAVTFMGIDPGFMENDEEKNKLAIIIAKTIAQSDTRHVAIEFPMWRAIYDDQSKLLPGDNPDREEVMAIICAMDNGDGTAIIEPWEGKIQRDPKGAKITSWKVTRAGYDSTRFEAAIQLGFVIQFEAKELMAGRGKPELRDSEFVQQILKEAQS